jgi:hypothetical protein
MPCCDTNPPDSREPYPDPMAADDQRYAGPDASICEARASACVSIYSRMFFTLPSRTVMSKTQSSLKQRSYTDPIQIFEY